MIARTPREWSKALLQELFKHAQRDGCYGCKQVLRAMGLNPEKTLESQLPKE